jgi:hypothetical protein
MENTMKHPIPVLLSFVVLALVSSSANAVAWSIIDLGSAHNANTMALNDNGWVVMGNKVLNPNGSGGYTTTQLFNAQGNDHNFALYDINNSNTVVGIDRNSGSVQGFVWTDGSRTNLPTVPNLYNYPVAEAKGINDSGQVVGNAGDTAAIWSPNGSGYGVTPLGWYWEGTSFGSGDGVSINNNGFGLMATVYNTYRPGYTNGLGLGITIMGDGLVGQPVGLAINDQYAVAGYGTYNCSGYGCNSPFIWTSGNNVAFLPLSPVEGKPYNGRAYALNEDNDVVGMGWYDAYDGRAVLWSASDSGWLETDLNTVLPVGSNFWKLTEARDINEKGQILGMGAVDGDWQPHAFLLTPAVPEPETWVMLLAGLGLTLLRNRLH